MRNLNEYLQNLAFQKLTENEAKTMAGGFRLSWILEINPLEKSYSIEHYKCLPPIYRSAMEELIPKGSSINGYMITVRAFIPEYALDREQIKECIKAHRIPLVKGKEWKKILGDKEIHSICLKSIYTFANNEPTFCLLARYNARQNFSYGKKGDFLQHIQSYIRQGGELNFKVIDKTVQATYKDLTSANADYKAPSDFFVNRLKEPFPNWKKGEEAFRKITHKQIKAGHANNGNMLNFHPDTSSATYVHEDNLSLPVGQSPPFNHLMLPEGSNNFQEPSLDRFSIKLDPESPLWEPCHKQPSTLSQRVDKRNSPSRNNKFNADKNFNENNQIISSKSLASNYSHLEMNPSAQQEFNEGDYLNY